MARSTERNKSDQPVKSSSKEQAPNPVWFKPIMFGFMAIGFIWIIVYYVSNQQLPIAEWRYGNIIAGFGILFVGFLMTTRWR